MICSQEEVVALARPMPTASKADLAHFDALHQSAADPWNVRTDWYERHKRGLLMAMLPQERYRLVFEPGCSIGENTAALAPRCTRLIAADFSPAALQHARERVAGEEHVQLERWDVPEQWPDEPLDLIVLAEFAYYLSPLRLERLWERCLASLAPDGQVLMCHWRRPIDDAWLGGDELHERAAAALQLAPMGRYCDDNFRIDIWQAAA